MNDYRMHEYKRVLQSVVVQATRDYQKGIDRKIILDWVENRRGTFEICATACDMTPEVLQEKLLKFFNSLE